MKPTPKMIEVAAKVFASEAFGTNYADADRLTKEEFKKTASKILKAALAAWWRPMKPEPQIWLTIIAKRKTGHVVVVEKPDDRPWYDPFTEVEWSDLSFFIPLSDFEDRK
ncbi:hypothetical protein [Acetobacter sicerae]|uniref:hypothetical protein n=1 Tax=Acetobacter sicerae TaxID=85325 RepID=UPI00156BC03D|nr:hypothetical protein [Acetobacter sicerae]NHN93859.1 hypothetical protein [Acetobacter sicerae]